MRTVSVLSSIFSIFFILGLKMDRARAVDDIENIRKVLIFIQDYQKGYDHHRRNAFTNRNKIPAPQYTWTPEPSMEEQSIELDLDYIRTQGKYGTFSELHSIFMAQILAMVYALKLRGRLYSQSAEYRMTNNNSWLEAKTIFYLAKFGKHKEDESARISSKIMKILEKKYPEACDEFERITEVFDRFQYKIRLHVFSDTREHERSNKKFLKELHRDAEKLVNYVMSTLLQRNPLYDDTADNSPEESDTNYVPEMTGEHRTGLGIDVYFDLKKLSFDTRPLATLILQQDPDKLYTNYDDTSKNNMFRSTAMNLLESLIERIASAAPNIGDETVKALRPVQSFLHVRPLGIVTNRFIFIEIFYTDMQRQYPAAVPNPNENKSSWMDTFINFVKF